MGPEADRAAATEAVARGVEWAVGMAAVAEATGVAKEAAMAVAAMVEEG